MPQRIFISYRRDDAASDAGRLADHLQRRFGADRVFLDVEAIEPGTDFVQVLQESLRQTAATLVVIGPRWVSQLAPDGTRRLDDPNDFVRLEVEAALGRNIRVVPVLVQGAALPRREDLPASLQPLVTRQTATLDYTEFHDDVERLCDRLAPLIQDDTGAIWPVLRRWWPAAALVAVVAVGLAGYLATRPRDQEPPPDIIEENVPPPVVDDALTPEPPPGTNPVPAPSPAEPANGTGANTGRGAALARARRVETLLAEASAQHRRGQSLEALATLAQARELAPASNPVRQMQEDVAMDWIRNVRVEGGKSSFGDAIKPALAVIDTSLPAATGARRADLLAHSGFAAFLMWRDGNRQLNPEEWYKEAITLDPGNPYANAMLAHWILFQGDDVPRAVTLFATALQAGREVGAVRSLQWAAYNNSSTPEANAERVRLADAMRRDGQRLTPAQAQALWSPYYFGTLNGRDRARQVLLDALPPDDHISTLGWAFEEYAANDESRRLTIRYYTALLDARAGRTPKALDGLRALDRELASSPGSLREAVRAAIRRLQAGR